MARKDSKGRNLWTGESERKDGTYMFRYTDQKTKRRQTVYAATLMDLREKEKDIKRDIEDGIVTTSAVKKMTLNMLFDRYMESIELAESMRVNYNSIWDHHLREDMGLIQVTNIKPSHIKIFYARLTKAGYSYSTIRLIQNLLYPSFEMALDDDLIRKNPCRKALKGNGRAPETRIALSPEQQEAMLEFVKQSNVYKV